MLVLALQSLIAAAGPLAVQLTDDEIRALESGAVVVRSPTDEGLLIGAVDIDAPTERVYDAVLDFDARIENVGAIKSIEVYAPMTDPKGLGAKFELSILGTAVEYSLRYETDPAHTWVTFALDPEREHDLVSSTGGYHITPSGDGQRLIYWAQTDAGRAIPGFIRNTLSNRSFKNQLGAMREHATK